MQFYVRKIIATTRVINKMVEDEEFAAFVKASLERYIVCDWGDLEPEDIETNNASLEDKSDILGAYIDKEHPDWKIWIRNDCGWFLTTVLFPDEN